MFNSIFNISSLVYPLFAAFSNCIIPIGMISSTLFAINKLVKPINYKFYLFAYFFDKNESK